MVLPSVTFSCEGFQFFLINKKWTGIQKKSTTSKNSRASFLLWKNNYKPTTIRNNQSTTMHDKFSLFGLIEQEELNDEFSLLNFQWLRQNKNQSTRMLLLLIVVLHTDANPSSSGAYQSSACETSAMSIAQMLPIEEPLDLVV